MLYLPDTRSPIVEQRSRSVIVLTNTIVDACSSAIGAAFTPMAFTSTVPDDFSNASYKFTTPGLSLGASQQISFGVFISAQNNFQSDLIFNVFGQFRYYGTAGIIIPSYFLGRCNNSTITVSTIAPANQLNPWNSIPATSVNSNSHDINSHVIGKYDSSNSNPYCFGLTLENPSAAEFNGYFNCELSIRKFASSPLKINTGSLL